MTAKGGYGMRWLRGMLTVIIASALTGVVCADPSLQDLQRQIDELRRIVQEQQKEIERLRSQLKQQQPPPAPQPTVTVPSGERLNFYGFLRLDSIFDSGLTNNIQTPFWVLSPSNANKRRTGNQQLSVHPRLTRIGINFAAPPNLIKGWDVTGKFEMDWQNAQGITPESRPLPRIRHAYLQLQRGDYSLLLGQTWDLISPLFPSPNDDTLMWNTGNLGDRRSQIRFTYEPQGRPFSWSVGLGLTGAVDSKDLDNNGYPMSNCGWRGKGKAALWGYGDTTRGSAPPPLWRGKIASSATALAWTGSGGSPLVGICAVKRGLGAT